MAPRKEEECAAGQGWTVRRGVSGPPRRPQAPRDQRAKGVQILLFHRFEGAIRLAARWNTRSLGLRGYARRTESSHGTQER